jgi:hypothetical protein
VTAGEKQRFFARLVGKLIEFAYAQGYELTFGEAKRTDEQSEINAMGPVGRDRLAFFIEDLFPVLAAKLRNNNGSGIRGSLHERSLAIDFNLFKDGQYLAKSEDHEPLGVFWESLDPLCTWGGRFGDGNHYSITDGGLK